jgi:hypothetical protein
VGCRRMRPGKPVALVETTELSCGHSDVGTVGIGVVSPKGEGTGLSVVADMIGEGVLEAAQALASA